MTNSEAISRVKKELKELNADSRLSNKFIYSKLKSIAKLLIQQESDKFKLAKLQNLYQNFKCIPMEEVSIVDCNCGIKSKCKIWRTSIDLPNIYSDSMGIIIKEVTSIDDSAKLTFTTSSRIDSLLKDPNSKYDNSIYCFYDNKRIYIVKKMIKAINVRAIYEDDISDHPVNCCSKEQCTRLIDREWLVPPKLEGVIIEEVIKSLLQGYKQIKEDSNINKSDTK